MADEIGLGGIIGLSLGQFIAGTIVGSAVDFVFPVPDEKKNWLQNTIEASLQIMVGAVATVAVSKLFNKILMDKSDPSGGIAYIISFYFSQPKLLRKIGLTSESIHKFYGRLVTTPMLPARMTEFIVPFSDSLHTL